MSELLPAGRPDSSDGHSGLPGDPRCEASMPRLAGPQKVRIFVICREPAAAFYRYACEHGHVRYGWCCLAHLPGRGQAGCRQCFVRGFDVAMTAELVRRA